MERFKINCAPVDRMLGIFGATITEPAMRATTSLAGLLQPVQQSSWPEVRYSFSRLTGDGFPVEFTFSSASDAISYTTEVAGPETCEWKKIDLATAWLVAKGNCLADEYSSAAISSLQHQPGLNYGAWVAGRHDNGKNDRFKIYLEVTDSSKHVGLDFLKKFLPDFSVLKSQYFSLRMLGLTSSNTVEYYFRLNTIDVWQLLYLMRCLGFSDQGKELLEFVALLCKRKIDRSFIGESLGFSVALNQAGIPEAISIFTFNYKVFEPGDALIRRSVLKFCDWFGWDFGSYEQVTKPLISKYSRLTNHGLVAFTTTLDAKKIFQIGLRPPDLS